MKKVYENNLKEYTIEQSLGVGSYNFVYLVSSPEDEKLVLRVSLMRENDAENAKSVMRGIVCVAFFQKYKQLLGSSCVDQVRTHKFEEENEFLKVNMESLHADMRDQIKQLQKDNISFRYAIQFIEYLEGERFTNIDENAEFYMFSLLWFIYTAQKTFKFSHRDLKAENIMYREYGKSRDFYFNYNNQFYYKFSAERVPVIIDYDFASISATQDQNAKRRVGTYTTAPPEAMMSLFDSNIEFSEMELLSYDWWSLGICFLESASGKTNSICFNERKMYTNYISTIYNVKEQAVFMQISLYILITALVTNEYDIKRIIPEKRYYEFNMFYADKVQDMFLDMFRSSSFTTYMRRYNNSVLEITKRILVKLLSWFPEERVTLDIHEAFNLYHVLELPNDMYMYQQTEIDKDEIYRDFPEIENKLKIIY